MTRKSSSHAVTANARGGSVRVRTRVPLDRGVWMFVARQLAAPLSGRTLTGPPNALERRRGKIVVFPDIRDNSRRVRRPVWLLSMDTETFCGVPMTTGALKAHYHRYGRRAAETEILLEHQLEPAHLERWIAHDLPERVIPAMRAAVAEGLTPLLGFSSYTWNIAEFLAIARTVKTAVPAAFIVAGGPHVQRAEDFLGSEAIDVIVIGEGEVTFTELLDCETPAEWPNVQSLAWLEGVNGSSRVVRTPERPRTLDIDRFPSALEVIELRDADGKPRYRSVAYETNRGCPYACAFCEWGTGLIGSKIYKYDHARVLRDAETLAKGGVETYFICDANYGLFPEDESLAAHLADLKNRYGTPRTVGTSWAKNHSERVRKIVRLFHREGLLLHYHLALQTVTPKALELSNRRNMKSNDYEPIARQMASEGIPIAAELIWGLPGETLAEFEQGLDRLLAVFPHVNIFAYTLLPGTEFYERREEYRIETVPVAGYGKARGEYVVGCHTFTRAEGEEGHFLVTAHATLVRGQILPRVLRFLAMAERESVSAMLRAVYAGLVEHLGIDGGDKIHVYEERCDTYQRLLMDPARTYAVVERRLVEWLHQCDMGDVVPAVTRLLRLDQAFCPRPGEGHTIEATFDFAADAVEEAISHMRVPAAEHFTPNGGVALSIRHPAGVGTMLRDPDIGESFRGRLL